MDKHELLSQLKAMALEQGETPSRDDFIRAVRNGRHLISAHFGNWAALVHAAGLEPQRVRKITNEVFRRDIDRQLEYHRSNLPLVVPREKPWPRIAILGDMHEPFAIPELKADFVSFVSKHEPEYVVQIGDAYDAYSHAKFPRSHNVFTPKQEETAARRALEEFWSLTRKAAPNAKLVQITGNHDVRPLKRVLEALPTLEHWAERIFAELLSFDGVHTVLDPREEYLIGDIAFIHGYRSQLGSHRDYMLTNVVTGHSHQLGAVYRNIQGKPLWELNAGYCADPTAKGLTYTNQKMNHWTHGWAWIDEYGPRAVPWRR